MMVETRAGTIRGRSEGGIAVFRGIPYAAPPVGDRRFRPPQPVAPWEGVLEADDYGPRAVQHVIVDEDGNPSTSGYSDHHVPYSEDCLRLHVWTPATDDRRRAVMVWIHGGAWEGGSGHGAWSDGAALASAEDVVVVSLNHRLGVFGFLDLEQLDPSFAGSGNAGLLDIVAALEWIREEIAGFGGDPGNVTVFGESGGGWKISCLLAMPAARGLFHRAIIQSGSYLRVLDREQSGIVVRGMLERLGIPEDGAARILDVPAEQLAAANAAVRPRGTTCRLQADGTVDWDIDLSPVVDGTVIPHQPFASGAPDGSSGIPVLVGVTEHEHGLSGMPALLEQAGGDAAAFLESRGVPADLASRHYAASRADDPEASDVVVFAQLMDDLMFGMAAIRQAEALARRVDAPVYAYVFCWPWEREGDRAVHAIDVPIVFGNLVPEVMGSDRDESTRAVSAAVGAAWAAFARTGDPNVPALPPWPRYDLDRRATMMLGHESRVVDDPRGERRRVLAGEE